MALKPENALKRAEELIGVRFGVMKLIRTDVRACSRVFLRVSRLLVGYGRISGPYGRMIRRRRDCRRRRRRSAAPWVHSSLRSRPAPLHTLPFFVSITSSVRPPATVGQPKAKRAANAS